MRQIHLMSHDNYSSKFLTCRLIKNKNKSIKSVNFLKSILTINQIQNETKLNNKYIRNVIYATFYDTDTHLF